MQNTLKRSPAMSLLLYLTLTVLSFFVLAPVVWLVLMSLSSPTDLTNVPLKWIPSQWDFSRYATLLDWHNGSGKRFLAAMFNSLIIAISASAIALFAGVLAAYAFSRRNASLPLMFAFLATIMMPPITYILPLYSVFSDLGILNTKLALIISYCAMLIPFAIWLMKTNIDVLPVEIEQAALVEGAGTLYTLRKVVLPIVLPAIGATAMLSFLTAWDEFFYALIFSSDLSSKTIPVAIADFSAGRVTDFGVIAAVGVLASIPPVLIAVFFQRFIVSGLVGGSVKG
ncbi:MAG: carbohydrate ABC transporter permease [Oceanospirillaceae bacterium]|nr:carbohydrate ABC transporter permease [Oceanospirillaceae bacterium]